MYIYKYMYVCVFVFNNNIKTLNKDKISILNRYQIKPPNIFKLKISLIVIVLITIFSFINK